ncbi:MAG: nucleotidyl transferase AbiEii/AbiGii toxin family protein [Candidatus Kerfeldbacteria bacterium]|nr:nucleotidyl transferase AbiEii/AbiGii toxin family protein [Candidatus Kerfeldbacteria bacterium]
MRKIPLLSRKELEIINRKGLKYPLAAAEKDYFLTLVSKIIYDSPLRNKLIFKGGTALHHTYLPQFRFSEDLDFSTNCTPLDVEEVKAIFAECDTLTTRNEIPECVWSRYTGASDGSARDCCRKNSSNE